MARPPTPDTPPYVPPPYEGVWTCGGCGGHLVKNAHGTVTTPMGATHNCQIAREQLAQVRRLLAGEESL